MTCAISLNHVARNMHARVGDVGSNLPIIGTMHNFGVGLPPKNRLVEANTTLLDEEDAEHSRPYRAMRPVSLGETSPLLLIGQSILHTHQLPH